MRDYNHPAFRTVHFGTSGIGKSTDFVKRLAAEKAQFKFIFDHKFEFAQKLRARVCQTPAGLYAATARGGLILFNHQKMFPGDRPKGFRWFCKFVYTASEHLAGRKILVADELQELAPPGKHPGEFIMCMDDGRSFKIDFMGIAQSPNGIHNLVRNQLTQMFVFRQSDKNAINHLEDNGFNQDQVRALRPGEWLWRNLNTGQAAKGGKAFRLNSAGMPTGGVAFSG